MREGRPAEGGSLQGRSLERRSLERRPAYGTRSLADLLGSILASLGVSGVPAPIALPAASRACLLVVDGLGWRLLERHAAIARFLSTRLDQEPATSAFPSSTAVSLTSIGTGATPGQHGITGYTMRLPPLEGVMSCLTWATYGDGRETDLRDRFPPEMVQPVEPLFGVAARSGVRTSIVIPEAFVGGGLTNAAYRGANAIPLQRDGGHEAQITAVRRALREIRSFVYTYLPDPDAAGHAHGVASEAWREALRTVDRFVRTLVERLPPDTLLVVTADHGMVDVPRDGWIDVAASPELARGVRTLGGDPRARHVYALDGESADVLARWRGRLEGQALVLSRAEVIAEGLMGPVVSAACAERIGDVVAIPGPGRAIVDRRMAPWEADLIGHHGALTDDEALVPLLTWLT